MKIAIERSGLYRPICWLALMDADGIVDLVIRRHEESSSEPIQVLSDLRLEPMLNYSGKMARKAYQGYRKSWHATRKYCGILDFRIIDPTGKMEHSQLLSRSLGKIPIDSLRRVYDGEDPFKLGLSDVQLGLMCDIQCSFAEQEINWGIHDFQLRTHFGYPEMRETHLSNAVPRDFFMLFFERCMSEIDSGASIEESLRRISDPRYRASFVASKMVLMPPIKGSGNGRKIDPEFRPFLRSEALGGASPWVEPFLGRISDLCEDRGASPYWERAHSNH